MRQEVIDYCLSCEICQKQKAQNSHQRAALVSIQVEKQWEIIGIDVAGPLRKNPTRLLIFYVDT